MNLYIRYFYSEVLVHNADEALDFLSSIPEIQITRDLETDIRGYASNDIFYPKRYKVRPRVYFIVIKTEAETMEDFKNKKAVRSISTSNQKKESAAQNLTLNREGWYEGELTFKRVVMIPSSGKHEYRDTTFIARCKALSGWDCYQRLVDYLKTRVDDRSQFPSAKGKNFRFKYLGLWK